MVQIYALPLSTKREVQPCISTAKTTPLKFKNITPKRIENIVNPLFHSFAIRDILLEINIKSMAL